MINGDPDNQLSEKWIYTVFQKYLFAFFLQDRVNLVNCYTGTWHHNRYCMTSLYVRTLATGRGTAKTPARQLFREPRHSVHSNVNFAS
jgi:hypothetical protein